MALDGSPSSGIIALTHSLLSLNVLLFAAVFLALLFSLTETLIKSGKHKAMRSIPVKSVRGEESRRLSCEALCIIML